MSDSPFFSVIIPTYNRSTLLCRAIDSVVSQTFPDWEIIIVDDGSTDDTKQKIEGYQLKNLVYIYQENKERSAARNRGIEEAKGQYICFLDDDDVFLANHFEVLHSAIKKQGFPVAVFRTGMIVSTETGEEKKIKLYNEKTGINPVHFFLTHLPGVHSFCYHRRILDQHQFDERWPHYQDTHLLIRILLDYPFFQTPMYTCIYFRYLQMGSLKAFNGNDGKKTELTIAAMHDLFDQGGKKLKALIPSTLPDELIAEKYLDHAGHYFEVGKRNLGWNFMKRGFKKSKNTLLMKEKGIVLVKFLGLFNLFNHISKKSNL